jgi:hypothetical protein
MEHYEEGMILSKLSGIRFKESHLIITTERMDDVKMMGRGGGILLDEQAMKIWLASRYRADLRLLDLSQLRSDGRLKEIGVRVDWSVFPFVQLLLKTARDMCPDVVSISFAKNYMHHLTLLQSLATQLPNLQNLNFDHNHLTRVEDLDPLMGLENVTELILTGNPICYRQRTQEQKNRYRR